MNPTVSNAALTSKLHAGSVPVCAGSPSVPVVQRGTFVPTEWFDAKRS